MWKLQPVLPLLSFKKVMSVFLAFVIIASGTTTAYAIPGGIDGCFFRDLNGSSIQGDAGNPSTNNEIEFTEPISVQLLDDVTNAVVATTTTDPTTGCFVFGSLGDGDYRINVQFPPEYYSSPVGGDTDFTPGAPPVIAGDPFTANYNFTYSSGDDLSITGGVSGLPELSLGYFITPGGDDFIETGSGPFDTTGTCPTVTPGDDCGEFDSIVRTNDTVTVGYAITADNIPDGNVNPLENVILEQTITPAVGAVIRVDSLHPDCLTTGVSPASGIQTDPVSGVITVTCNLGSKDNGTTVIPTYIAVDGQAENGSTFEIAARVYSAGDEAQVIESNTTLSTGDIEVSAAPRFDITKGNDSTNPYNRVIYLQTTERVNASTGVTEYGVNYLWDISVLYDGGTKGQAALDGAITFSDAIPSMFDGWQLVGCSNQPYTSGLPRDNSPETDWGDRGTWSCVEDYANNEIDITVTDVDTDGDPVPTEGDLGQDLSAGPFIAFAGQVRIWYPLSEFYQSVDPDWEYGDPAITGDYSLENIITNFDPTDAAGQSNFLDDDEPLGNNDRTINVPIRERGGFSKQLGSYEWADDRLPDGVSVGTASAWPCSSSSIPQGSLMDGQTNSCNSGDAPGQAGQKAQFWYWTRNDGTFPWASETFEMCDAFDNSTMTLSTWTGGEPLYARTNLDPDSVIIEYATADWNDDVANNDWTNRLDAISDCTAPNNDWSTDAFSFDPDPTTSLQQIGMVRIRVDETIEPEILPSQYVQVSMPIEIRNTYWGGPNAGDQIAIGTIMANNANRKFGSTDWRTTQFDPLNYTDSGAGDRITFTTHQVRVEKTTSVDTTSPTDDDLTNVQGNDIVIWWLQPAVTAISSAIAPNVVITDTLPAGVSYRPLCQASQTLPAGVTLASVTSNPDGTTTVVFDLGDRPTNVAIDPIPLCTGIDNFLEPGTDLTNYVEIQSDTDISPPQGRSDDRTVSVVASGQFQLAKSVDAPLELQLDTQTYQIGWTNLSTDFDFLPPDVIDVFPYNGDAINPLNIRTEFDSRYTGDYFLTNFITQPTTTLVDGSTESTAGTWYYSADDPDTIPYDPDNPNNDLATGTVTWCTEAEVLAGVAPCDFALEDITAARFIQTDILAAESSVSVTYEAQAGTVLNPNAPADRYVNRFAGRTDSVDDLIRSNETLVQVMSMNIGDLVFIDADVDGAFTAGVDVPVQGTVVELYRLSGGVATFVDSTFTDVNGRYVFEELLEGTYEVRIPDSELAGGTLDSLTQTINPQPADNNDNETDDHQAFDSTLGYTSSGPITLDPDTTVDPPIGQEPEGENTFSLGSPYVFDNLSNMSVDLGFRGDPDIQLIKEVCDVAIGVCDPDSDPLDPDDGWVESVVTPYTNDVTWRITIVNTGYELLTNFTVTDPIESSCDIVPGDIPDIGVNGHYSYTCVTSEAIEDILNTAEVIAEGAGSGISVDDADSAESEVPGGSPDIEIIKYVNGDDAETAPGIYLEPGAAVTFTYEVTLDSGIVPLNGVTVTDDNGTPADATDDFSATYTSGDTDGDSRLDIDETWLFTAAGFTAQADQYANWATAEGTGVTGGSAETDSNAAHYFGVDADIDLTKRVNGVVASTAPGIYVPEGDPVTFTYELENTGNSAVAVNQITDDAGTPADLSDDWTANYVSGDDDSNGLLDVDETWLFEYTGEVAIVDQYTNTAQASVTDLLGEELTDDSEANYFGSSPEIAIEKSTNGQDADSDPVIIAADSPVTWTYTVTNPGNVPLSDVTVTDDNGTPADATDDFTATYAGGDLNLNDLLDTDETWTFTATGTADADDTYTNNAEVTGDGPDTTNPDGTTTDGEEVQDEDPSNYIASRPEIAIEKTTNGGDDVIIDDGAPITWTYTVSNPGNVPLSDVTVTDDNGTPADATDDFTATYESGDTNSNDLLDTDETWIFTATGTANADNTYTNNAEVTGDGPDTTNPDGTTTDGEEVQDEDDSSYTNSQPEIAIEKTTNGGDNDNEPGVYISLGDVVNWTYSVSNPGNVPLSDVTVTDDNGTPADATDDFTATYESGDTNSNDLLDIDETWIFTATGTATTGQYTNIAEVTGDGPDTTNPDGTTTDGEEVQDEDPSNYFGADAAVQIVKTVNGQDANEAPGVFINAGEPATWSYEVTNTGNVPLINLTVSDDQGVTVVCPPLTEGVLLPGETTTCSGEGIASDGSYVNVGLVEAQPAFDCECDDGYLPIVNTLDSLPVEPVTDDDPANSFGSAASIELQKEVCVLDEQSDCDETVDAHWGEQTLVRPNTMSRWRLTVTNTGNVNLVDIEIDDKAYPECNLEIESLAIGETNVHTCEVEFSTPMTNVATVTATPEPEGLPQVEDLDDATLIEPPALRIEKTVSQNSAFVGNRLEYQITIFNDSPTSATDVVISDLIPAALGNLEFSDDQIRQLTDGTLEITISEISGNSSVTVTYSAEILAVGDIINTVNIISDHLESIDAITPDGDDLYSSDAATVATEAPILSMTGVTTKYLLGTAVMLLLLGLVLVRPTKRSRRENAVNS